MTNKEKIEELEAKIQQAYQVIGTLLAGPDSDWDDFFLPEGQRALDYFAHEEYDDNFLPFIHPRLKK
ncbi:hypothetical protein GAO09_00365 [Rhizobiales bacterium RZME27]|jgi:hypothetical protein|uniref:Uncharacterized protein n=1 Tax=Endobacterium cereale TaxID=2663029 RepID=A0A6A8A447_9HYPH|nr:hypothetical protein [Endobacterium cereale]MQY44528.1 hypothetical protein [Endobacterium cereale]